MERAEIIRQILTNLWTVLTVMTLLFINFSRVPGARIMRTRIMRTYLRGTRDKFTFFSVNTVNCPEKLQIIRMFSRNPYAYRTHAHTVRAKDLLFHLYMYYGWKMKASGNAARHHDAPH